MPEQLGLDVDPPPAPRAYVLFLAGAAAQFLFGGGTLTKPQRATADAFAERTAADLQRLKATDG